MRYSEVVGLAAVAGLAPLNLVAQTGAMPWGASAPLVATQDSWLRAIPSAGADQDLALPEGADGLQAVGCIEMPDGSWCLVETLEGPGWVEAGALAADPDPSAVPDAALPPQGRVVVANVTSRLNVRSGPGTDNPVVDRLRVGTLLRRSACQEGATYRWCAVARDGETEVLGWAAADFLEPADARRLAAQQTFDRIGQLPCRMTAEAPDGSCPFGVSHGDGDTAAVTVFLPGDSVRIFDFYGGRFVLTDLEQAQAEAATMAVNAGEGSTVIDIGPQHFVIADALLAPSPQTAGDPQ